MEHGIVEEISDAAKLASVLAKTLERARAAATKSMQRPLKRELTQTSLELGELASKLGRIFPSALHRPFQFVIATGQYNPNATENEDEYPDEPPAHFTICIQHAIRVIGGKVKTFLHDDDLPDILFERQTVGKWLMFCSHQNTDPACVVEINDDRSTEIYDVNYWAGNVRDRRGSPLYMVAFGTVSNGWRFIGPFPNKDNAWNYGETLPSMQVLPLNAPQKN